ncbi:MAG TPA: PAS domain S-box protein [Acidimicrobiales bacterium]|nr:PAS domain S-box protein [Acidimicrobiales bacterium]
MHTPALGRRIVVIGVTMVWVLGLSLDALVYVSVRATLMDGISRDLDRDASLVSSEAARVGEAELAGRLTDLGLRATIREADGRLAVRQPTGGQGGRLAVRTVQLPGGKVVEVKVSRARVDSDLHRLLRLELIVTPLVVGLAFVLLRLMAEIALRPLDRISAAARRTAKGRRGERLRPHPTDTRLGQMASAYDDMLDALEAAVVDAQAAQAESSLLLERNRRVIDTAREAFVAVDDAGVIVDWNTEAERIFGWRKNEVLGRPVVGTVLPDDVEGSGRAFQRSRGTGDPSDGLVEITAMHRDGHRFPAKMTVWSTDHHGTSTVSAFIWDTTEREAAAAAVARLAAIVESTDAAMLSTTLDGTILTWNAAAERMYGYSADEAIGSHLHIIVPVDEREQLESTLGAVWQGAAVQRVEAVRRCKNGELVAVALTISPVRDADGVVSAASSIARDITEERWMAAQLNQTLAALEASLEEAREAEAASRRFLDDAAHQLRTPITNIRACAESLLAARGDERDELLGAVVRETSRAGRLMSGLLRLAQLNHTQEMVREPCDLLGLCRGEAERVAALAPHLELSVEETGAAPVGRPLLDPNAVAEILSNLLDNARRYADTRIELNVHRDGPCVEVEVMNDGPSEAEDLIESAFERFVTLDSSGGSGLGLPIARELARAHGGDLFYQDKAFVLQLPSDEDGMADENRPD